MTPYRTPARQQESPSTANHIIAIVVIALLWIVACAIPSLSLGGAFPGWLCVLLGPFAVFYLCPAWFANLTWIGAVALLWRRRYAAAIVLTVASVLLAAGVIRLFYIDVTIDDTDKTYRLQHLALGFWVWLLSLVTPGIVAARCQLQKR
ncbi:MAG: hypothetical protein ACLQBL_35015 [Polyangiaceae bacterium]